MTVSHAVRIALGSKRGVGSCAVRTPGFVERFSGLDEPEEAQAVDVLELERHA